MRQLKLFQSLGEPSAAPKEQRLELRIRYRFCLMGHRVLTRGLAGNRIARSRQTPPRSPIWVRRVNAVSMSELRLGTHHHRVRRGEKTACVRRGSGAFRKKCPRELLRPRNGELKKRRSPGSSLQTDRATRAHTNRATVLRPHRPGFGPPARPPALDITEMKRITYPAACTSRTWPTVRFSVWKSSSTRGSRAERCIPPYAGSSEPTGGVDVGDSS